MFLGIMLGASAFVSTAFTATNAMVESIKQLSQNVNLDFNVLLDSLWQSVQSLDWSNPVQAVKTALSAEWLNNALTQSLSSILGTDFETFKVNIVEIVNVFLQSISAGTAVFFVFWILGFIAGYWILRFLIRRTIARRSMWKFILAYFLRSLISAMFLVTSLILFAMWSYSLIFTLIVAVLFGGVIAFIQAYLLYAYKKIKFFKIVNFKNAGMYALSNAIIFAMSVLATVVAVWINAFAGIFVGLSLITIASIVINLNAESYVIERVQNLSATASVNGASEDMTATPDEPIDEIK